MLEFGHRDWLKSNIYSNTSSANELCLFVEGRTNLRMKQPTNRSTHGHSFSSNRVLAILQKPSI